MLGSWIDIYNPADGSYIGIYDDQTGDTQVADPADQAIADEVAAQIWMAQGGVPAGSWNGLAAGGPFYDAYGNSYATQAAADAGDLKLTAAETAAVAQGAIPVGYAGTHPPPVPPSGWTPQNLLKLASGALYKYPYNAQTRMYGAPMPLVTPGIFGNISPMMLAAIGAIGFIALSGGSKGKRS